jgi:hypothetical protein
MKPTSIQAILIFSLLTGPIPEAMAQSPTTSTQNMSDWVVVNEFGESKCFVDRASVEKSNAFVRAWVKYALTPPGMDKINKKAVKEILMLEEYHLNENRFRLHRIVFNYVDGTMGEPLSPQPEWRPATGGNEKTLEFLRAATGPESSADMIRGFDLPKQLGQFELRSMIDNEKTNSGLSHTLFYNALGVKASVFVYDHSRRGLLEGVDSPASQEEFAEAKANLEQANPDAQVMVREERLSVAGVPLLHAAYQYKEIRPGSRETVFSHLYLTSRRGSFVKVRATYSANDRPDLGYRLHVQFVEELCRVIGK